MLLLVTCKIAIKSLLANKLRSFLATLGIIIGVGAVISMLALGAGAQKQVMDRITSMGTDLLMVQPGAAQSGGVRGGARETLRLEDAEALLRDVEGITALAPAVRGRYQVKYGNQNASTNILGVSLTYLSIRNFAVAKGRAFSVLEEERGSRVALLGSFTAESLLGAADPIGETVRVKGINYRVVGVLKSKGDQGWFNPDDLVMVPYQSAMKDLLGQPFVNEINVQAEPGADKDRLLERMTAVLRKRHRIRPDAPDDFNIRNQAEILETASSITRTFTVLLGGIAGISLLVGGIGIMNIMLVTVTERTREIGVRKAIGARDRDILRQFLLEAMLICGLGGAVGVGLGLGVAAVIPRVSDFTAFVQWQAVAMALGVAVSVGIFFGWMPARRAAKLDPIEALRYE